MNPVGALKVPLPPKGGEGGRGQPLRVMGRQGRILFPLLDELASRVLCVTATCASSERLFSKARLTATKRWKSFKPDKVAQLAMVRGALTSALLDEYPE